jgi:signal-transduction protein with cAMP-binding, CBS, and nucleotidyltransferase domain
VIRIVCIMVFVGGIAGMIVSSINGNNVGLVTTIGLVTATSALVLMTASTVANRRRIDVFDDATAEHIERRIGEMVERGVDEGELRSLIRDSIDLGRSIS